MVLTIQVVIHDVNIIQNKEPKQTVETAQYGLEVTFSSRICTYRVYCLTNNCFTISLSDTEAAANGRLNYSRLCHLLINVGSKALKQTFDRIIPPQNLQRILKRNSAHSKLQSRRKEGVLNSFQWSKLYPTTPSEVSSAGFDISLLIVLLRTICGLSPPPAGWDAAPLAEDTSCESDIARVKYFLTAVSRHAAEGSISDAVFTSYWQQIRDTLVRLGGTDYEDVIDEMKDQEMDLLNEEHFRELLKQWRKVEDSIKDKLNELESVEASVVSGKL